KLVVGRLSGTRIPRSYRDEVEVASPERHALAQAGRGALEDGSGRAASSWPASHPQPFQSAREKRRLSALSRTEFHSARDRPAHSRDGARSFRAALPAVAHSETGSALRTAL